MYLETVDWTTLNPCISSSPWIRGEPHSRLSRLIRKRKKKDWFQSLVPIYFATTKFGELRPADLFARAPASRIVPAVRVNPLDGLGMIDLATVVPARPALIFLPKAETARQIAELATTVQPISLQRSLIPQQHCLILDQLPAG